ncbi:MAG: peptidoglycan bridge formation glycyltransferase FemA/FemB family protein [Bacillota bacterium]|nr:peptidoglycan bridge formation glycyltransferase FemA/FemB family protein [Bacillota bacterium]
MVNVELLTYSNEYENIWDNFIANNSANGTFLQTRRFLNYHNPDKFQDNSLIFKKKNSTDVVALVPACQLIEEGKRVFYSHKGSTFGGIVINNKYNNIEVINYLVEQITEYCKENKFQKIILKNTPALFSENNTEALDYFLYKHSYNSYRELSFYIDYSNYEDCIIRNFSSNKKRGYKSSLKWNLKFRKISEEEIIDFYKMLCSNLKKHNTKPVHTYKELLDLKFNRLNNNMDFYGVFLDEKIIAGSMVFLFSNRVLHTQYLAVDAEYLNYYAMNFLNYNLIKLAKDKDFKYFSFGICTEDNGKYLNLGLAKFKKDFGTQCSNNITYYKEL